MPVPEDFPGLPVPEVRESDNKLPGSDPLTSNAGLPAPSNPILPEVRRHIEEVAKRDGPRTTEEIEREGIREKKLEVQTSEEIKKDELLVKAKKAESDSMKSNKTDKSEKPESLSKETAITGASGPEVKQSEDKSIEKEMGEILKEYGGLESNIPLHNNYWTLANKLRALRAPKF